MPTMMQDLRFALRQLRRAPGFAFTAVLTLALGIGATTAIFSLLDQALLRSLPIRDAQRLVYLQGTGDAWNGRTWSHGGSSEDSFSYPMYKDLRDQSKAFAELIATIPAEVGVTRGESSRPVGIELVSGNYFTALGVGMALGRPFTQADDVQPNAAPVAVLSYDFWRNGMAADPGIVGSTLNINGHTFTVTGVATPSFHSVVWGETPALWVPLQMTGQVIVGQDGMLADHTARWLTVLGRLQPGETPAQAAATVAPLWHALRAEEVKSLKGVGQRFVAAFVTNSRLAVHPAARGYSYRRENLQTPFLAIMAMAVLVLGIAAVNVASLLLVRAAGRVREFSLRAALGAGFGRIVRQLLLEGLLIGLLGGVAGLLLAPLAMHALVSAMTDPDGLNPFSAALDARVLGFNFAVALGVSLLFSLVPAVQLRRLRLTSTLRESAGTVSGSGLMLRRVVVALQVGLSVLLLVASGLFLRTLQHLRQVNVGFTTAHLLNFSFDPTLAGYSVAQTPAVQQRVLDALAAVPGVASVGATSDPELANNGSYANVSVSGHQAPPDERFNVESAIVTPGYLAVLGKPLLAGRMLTEADDASHPPAAVVNESFSRHFCGSPVDCVGHRLGLGTSNDPGYKMDTEIVGVVADSKHVNLRDPVSAGMYRPLRQMQADAGMAILLSYQSVYVRTLADPAAVIAGLRRAVHGVEPGLAIGQILTMNQQIGNDLQNDRLIALLAVAFGALATVLAAIGLYGVLAYSTAQRTREIGIRMALGSTRWGVSSLILRDVLTLAVLGVAVALPVAWGLSRLLRAQLFGVSAADPVVLLAAVGIIALASLAAALVPARRAAAVEPSTALRAE